MEYSDNLLKRFLLISLLIHSLFFLSLPRLKVVKLDKFRKNFVNLEVTYKKNLKIEGDTNKRLAETVEKRMDVNKEQLKSPSEVRKSLNPPAYTEGAGSIRKKTGPVRIKTPVIRQKTLSNIVTYPEVSSPFAKNPAYMSYYDVIRDRIRAVAGLNSPLTSEGEVYLTFVLDSNGQLKALKLISEKSVSDQKLRQLAYNFVEQASPFPPFPSDLKHSQLSFTVIIEFRLSD